ncbi:MULTISPECIES: TetR/AcrR family transcriptional regulator [unclassified Amycolatopsis]|uniref:TetR/AcrR family transcriptional regulator n=1 Tax=unclassified Amycolatopsis TaxID=2618356 RepID=UPI001FF4EDBC|nr:TetR/AcrR family transcriptional regulator [Amycolatopsis sp. FBCC-B4732]UOX92152.1 TetR/AcrR family transcriptional regulator [Amycolatopsis sp. FBCC-B4732]
MPSDPPPQLTLRERKKREARKALAQAALRLTLDRGLENVKVEDIATEVGVSPRTFNNYFSSKEQAVCSVVVDRHEGMREALLARPDGEPLWDSVKYAVLEQYSREGEPDRAYVARIRELMGRLMLRGEFLNAHAAVERVLAETIAKRVGGVDHLLCRLMAASVESAVRVAFTNWFTTEGEPFLPILERLLDELSAGMPTLTAGTAAPQPEPTTTALGESLC